MQQSAGTNQAASSGRARLESVAQVLTVEPGTYAVETFAASQIRDPSGMFLPCIRLDPLDPSSGSPGITQISSKSGTTFTWPGEAPCYLKVSEGPASVLLTIYKSAAGMKPPEIRITRVEESQAAPKPVVQGPPEELAVTVHLSRVGDVSAPANTWSMMKDGAAVEGFSIVPGGRLHPSDIEYQAVLGRDWNTPWFSNGDLCGSRGLCLPILGFRIRLKGQAAAHYACEYWGDFEGVHMPRSFSDGELCAPPEPSPLRSMKVLIVRKSA